MMLGGKDEEGLLWGEYLKKFDWNEKEVPSYLNVILHHVLGCPPSSTFSQQNVG